MPLSPGRPGLSAALTAVFLPAAALVAGCTSSAPAGPVADASLPGYSVTLDVALAPDEAGSALTFLTPSVSLFSMPESEVVGRYYYVATFQGGFDQGVDLDLDHQWDVVPPDLHVKYVSPPKFQSGPYDVSFIVYTKTDVTAEMRADIFGVVPKSGELSAFSLSQDRVLPGDPSFSNGVVRVNIEDADGEAELENRHDIRNVPASLTDTVLTVP